MPRSSTGNPRGRPKGTGKLGEQTRLTVRIPTDLYARLEAFAAGRHFHRGNPQLAGCVRDALEEYLTRHTKRQTEIMHRPSVENIRQTKNGMQVSEGVAQETEGKNRQTINTPSPTEQSRNIISQPVIKQEEPGAEPAKVLGAPIQENRQTENGVPAYDTTKYVLGKLCPGRHDFQGTGQTLLTLPKKNCRACENERKREQRQTKRQGQPA